jgi:hypothetical protein
MLVFPYDNPVFQGVVNFDEVVRNPQQPSFVIPVETGIQSFQLFLEYWIPAFAGMTTYWNASITRLSIFCILLLAASRNDQHDDADHCGNGKADRGKYGYIHGTPPGNGFFVCKGAGAGAAS